MHGLSELCSQLQIAAINFIVFPETFIFDILSFKQLGLALSLVHLLSGRKVCLLVGLDDLHTSLLNRLTAKNLKNGLHFVCKVVQIVVVIGNLVEFVDSLFVRNEYGSVLGR